MSYFWLLFTFTWFGSVRLQYINTAGPGSNILDNLDASHYPLPLPYISYINLPNTKSDFDVSRDDNVLNSYNHFSVKNEDLQRKRRTINEASDSEQPRKIWETNLVDIDKTYYMRGDEKSQNSPFIIQSYTGNVEENGTLPNVLDSEEKRDFNPWRGKKDKPFVEQTWTWKRSANFKEPSMPKRVRFSPWGGKRNGQVIYKPGTKGSKVIFSSSVPELTKIISNYSPNGDRFNLAGFQIMPLLNKRHPVRILALSKKLEGGFVREALPYKDFVDSLPRIFKPGHPYVDVNMKKDGKRKVVFSIWGGKRSPPIIGPIWTPLPQSLKDLPMSIALLDRSRPDLKPEEHTTKALY